MKTSIWLGFFSAQPSLYWSGSATSPVLRSPPQRRQPPQRKPYPMLLLPCLMCRRHIATPAFTPRKPASRRPHVPVAKSGSRPRGQRALSHLHLPAAHHCADRLVRRAGGDARGTRFKTWGLINDPGCCTPGSDGCPAKSHEETYGFDWCPGDETLLKFVGKAGYRDPACDFMDASAAASDPDGHQKGREDSCNLAFGTSTGALGFRKFPNPRFDAAAWKQLNGRLGTWEGYNRKLSTIPPAPISSCANSPTPRSSRPSSSAPLRVLPRRLQPGQAAARSRTPEVGEPFRPGRQPVHPSFRNPHFRHAARRPAVAALRPRAPRHLRHLGDSQRPGETTPAPSTR